MSWQRTRNHEGFTRGARALLALGCVLLYGWWAEWQAQLMPVLLGVIASALTETDDNWRGRLRAQGVALGCFALMATAVWALQPWPWMLGTVLSLSACVLTLLGAVSERYRAIAFGSLILSIYAALAAQTGQTHAAQAIPLMLAGATWYGVVSVLWFAAAPGAPVRHRLSQLYALLGEYLRLKAQLLEPVRGVDLERRRIALALHNGRVVDALNAAKESLHCRMDRGQALAPWLETAMHQYLSAQDVHERVSSSHEHYDLLADAFFHTDALYRCQRVLTLLGEQALKLSVALREQSTPVHRGATATAIKDMESAIAHLDAQASPRQAGRPLRSLHALGDNLCALARVLAGALHPPADSVDHALLDRHPRTFGQAWARVRAQLHPASPWLRHAVRLGLSLFAGFTFMQLTHDPHGYWILLAIVFISQPQYVATVTRLTQRIGGTALGLAVGWALVQLFPDAVLQAMLSVVAGAVFLGTRQTRYQLATGAATVLLLLGFHQLGLAEGVILARLLDTAVGGAIAAAAAWLVLPHWQSHQWPHLAAQALRTQALYLREILTQYQSGKRDHLAYRLARRNAHNADAALSNAFGAMLKEPARVRRHADANARFLLLSHTLLNYMSALGAQRGKHAAGRADPAAYALAQTLRERLEALAQELESHRAQPWELIQDEPPPGNPPAGETRDASTVKTILQAQLQLVGRLLPEGLEPLRPPALASRSG